MAEHVYSTKACRSCGELKTLDEYHGARFYECKTCHEVKPLSQFGRYPKGSREKSCIVCVEAKAKAKLSKPCRVCGAEHETGTLRWGYCRTCFKTAPFRSTEYRRQERIRKAEREGRIYRPGKKGPRPKHDAHVKNWRAFQRKQQAEQRQQVAATKAWMRPGLTKAEQFALRYRLDAEFNLRQRIRAAMKRKRQGIRLGEMLRGAMVREGRSPKAEAFIGYSAAELRTHLERQFTKGMTWKAFCEGRIHIDHIVPLSSFDLSNVEELRAAWQLPNLRPAWARENLIKRDKRIFLI